MQIINLTQHQATPDQIEAGVIDLTGSTLDYLKKLITFDELPKGNEMSDRAEKIVQMVLAVAKDLHIAHEDINVMIGGAPFFMSRLEKEFIRHDIFPLYSFTQRVAVDVPNTEGGVTKTEVFKHIGWVMA